MVHSAEHRFEAMGTNGHVVVVGPSFDQAEELAAIAQPMINRLESQWSRFQPGSDTSTLNRSQGEPVPVQPDTFDLVATSLAASALTGDRFDPTLLPALEALGYDRTFSDVADSPVPARTRPRANSVLDIEVDETTTTIRMKRGVTFDPGAIGKGMAADLVSARLMAAGARGVLVNLGGDVRVRGVSPTDEPAWIVSIREPRYSDDVVATVAIANAAVATSTTLRRTWRRGNESCHHLIDPATLTPAQGPCVVSTIASTGWWAEASATALSINPEPAIANVPSLIIQADGVYRAGGFEQFELETAR